MEQTTRLAQLIRLRKVLRNPVKLTSLLYLKEALLAERYEECREFIEIAREFGAQAFEIQNILEDPRRIPQA
jgi:hypothetical protein